MKERAIGGFSRGVLELARTCRRQPRREMTGDLYDRFTGLAQVRRTLAGAACLQHGARVFIASPGKNAWAVRQVLREMGAMLVTRERKADAIVIGTLSPGPMLDACEKRQNCGKPAVMPWTPLVHAPRERQMPRRMAG